MITRLYNGYERSVRDGIARWEKGSEDITV